MELVILKAKSQLNRILSGERRSSSGERARGGGGARGAGRERSAMAPAAPAPATPTPWLNATIIYNVTRLNNTFDVADYDLLNINSTDEHNNHWFCAKWSSAQQDLFQVLSYRLPPPKSRNSYVRTV